MRDTGISVQRILLVACVAIGGVSMIVGTAGAFDTETQFEVGVNSDGSVVIEDEWRTISGTLTHANATPKLNKKNQKMWLESNNNVTIYVDLPSNSEYNFTIAQNVYDDFENLDNVYNVAGSTDSRLKRGDSTYGILPSVSVSDTTRSGYDKVLNVSGVFDDNELIYKTDIEPSDEVGTKKLYDTPYDPDRSGDIVVEDIDSLDTVIYPNDMIYLPDYTTEKEGEALSYDGTPEELTVNAFGVRNSMNSVPDTFNNSLIVNEIYPDNASFNPATFPNGVVYENITVSNVDTQSFDVGGSSSVLYQYQITFDSFNFDRLLTNMSTIDDPRDFVNSSLYSSTWEPNMIVENDHVQKSYKAFGYQGYNTSIRDKPLGQFGLSAGDVDVVNDGDMNPIVIGNYEIDSPESYFLMVWDTDHPVTVDQGFDDLNPLTLPQAYNFTPSDTSVSGPAQLQNKIGQSGPVLGISDFISPSDTDKINIDINTSEASMDSGKTVVVPHVITSLPNGTSFAKPLDTTPFPSIASSNGFTTHSAGPSFPHYSRIDLNAISSTGSIKFDNFTLNSAGNSKDVTVQESYHSNIDYRLVFHPEASNGSVDMSQDIGFTGNISAGFNEDITKAVDASGLSDGDTLYAVLHETQSTGYGNALKGPNGAKIIDTASVTISGGNSGNDGDNLTATIEVDEDKTDAEEVVVEKVNYSEGDYFVVVEDEQGDQIGESEELTEGKNENVSIELDNPVGANTTLNVSIYESDGGSVGDRVGDQSSSEEVTVDVIGGGSGTTTLPLIGDVPLGLGSILAILISVLGLFGVGIWYYYERRNDDSTFPE